MGTFKLGEEEQDIILGVINRFVENQLLINWEYIEDSDKESEARFTYSAIQLGSNILNNRERVIKEGEYAALMERIIFYEDFNSLYDRLDEGIITIDQGKDFVVNIKDVPLEWKNDKEECIELFGMDREDGKPYMLVMTRQEWDQLIQDFKEVEKPEKEYELIKQGLTRNDMIREGLRYLEFEFDAIQECAKCITSSDGDKELAQAVGTIRKFLDEVLEEE